MKKLVPLLLGTLALAACGDRQQPDTTPPTVSLSLSAGTVQAPGSVTLTATATDNVGVSSVQFYRGNEPLGSGTAGANNTYTRTVNLTAADAGQLTFRVVAADAAGNRSEASAALTVTVPVQQGTLVNGVVVEQNGTAWVGGSGVVRAASSRDLGVVLAEGTLTTTGAFSVTLPQPADTELMAFPAELLQPSESLNVPGVGNLILNCQPTNVNTSALPRVLPVTFTVQTASRSGVISPIRVDETQISSVAGMYLYTERAATISGQTECTAQYQGVNIPVVYTYNVSLQPGWNTLRLNVVPNLTALRIDATVTAGELPGQWVFSEQTATPLSLFGKTF